MNYTKGEWKVNCGIRTKEHFIASTNGTDVSPDEEAANARLMAAAPDMYEALVQTQIILSDMELSGSPLNKQQTLLDIKITKALAKAEGNIKR